MNPHETLTLQNNGMSIRDELVKNLLLLYPLRVNEVCNIRMDDIDITHGALRLRKCKKPEWYIDINEKTRQLLCDFLKIVSIDRKFLFTKDNGDRYSMKDILSVTYTFPWEAIIVDPKYDAHIKRPLFREIIVRKFIAKKCFRISNVISNRYRQYLLELLLDFLPEGDGDGAINYKYRSDWLATVRKINYSPIADFRWTIFMIKKFCDFLQETELIVLEGAFSLNYPELPRRKYKLHSKGENKIEH